MTSRTAARRYARALFDVAVQQGDPRQVGHDLETFHHVMTGHAPLQRALRNPSVPVGRRRAIVEELAKRTELTSIVTKLLLLLAERDRVAYLPEIVEAYRDRLMDHLKVVQAEVTTALPMTEEQTRKVQDSLGRATGRSVTLVAQVDPAIVGGVVARVGSTVYDGSVRRQLELIKTRMSES